MEFAALSGTPTTGVAPARLRTAGAVADALWDVADALDVPIRTAMPAVSTRAITQAIAIGVAARNPGFPAGAAAEAGDAVSGARQRGQCVRRAYVFVPHAAHLIAAATGLPHFTPGQDPHARLTNAVVEVLRIAEHLQTLA
jgi:hypothetical protein